MSDVDMSETSEWLLWVWLLRLPPLKLLYEYELLLLFCYLALWYFGRIRFPYCLTED